MNKLTIYDGGIRNVKGVRKAVILFEITAPEAVPTTEGLSLRATMLCDPNYLDGILKNLKRLRPVPTEETVNVTEG